MLYFPLKYTFSTFKSYFYGILKRAVSENIFRCDLLSKDRYCFGSLISGTAKNTAQHDKFRSMRSASPSFCPSIFSSIFFSLKKSGEMQEIPFCCRINVIDLNSAFCNCDVPLIQEIHLCLSLLGDVGGPQSAVHGTSLCPGGGGTFLPFRSGQDLLTSDHPSQRRDTRSQDHRIHRDRVAHPPS